jgi:acetyl-CoA synthetase
MTEVEATIDALLSEKRVFEPPEGFRRRALWNDPSVYERAAADPEAFWAGEAGSLAWSRTWDRVMEWNPPWVKWFLGGELNASYNCLDRHLEAGGGDKVAYYWEGEPGEERTITYRQLYEEVCRFANGLKSLGVSGHLPGHGP